MMKNARKVLAASLCLLLSLGCLTGCAAPGARTAAGSTGSSTAAPASSDGGGETLRCVLADGADTGTLLLAAEDGGEVYTLTVGDIPVTVDGKAADAADLTDGMTVTLTTAGVEETFPARPEGVTVLAAETPISGGYTDLCGLYLRVLEDLWNADPGLNRELRILGVDISAAPGLTESQRSAVAWQFGQLHGLEVVTGTWEELAEQGYIDKEKLQWEEGCLFSISESETGGGTYSLPTVCFDAEKWRSGTGACFFSSCTCIWPENGSWSDYAVGSQAIS